MFRMSGKKTELYRYKIVYTEDEIEMIENCISEDHKNEVEQTLEGKGIGFVTTPVNQADNEWFNGLEFESYDEALSVFSKGEQAYLQEKQRKELTDNLRLRADIDRLKEVDLDNKIALTDIFEMFLS